MQSLRPQPDPLPQTCLFTGAPGDGLCTKGPGALLSGHVSPLTLISDVFLNGKVKRPKTLLVCTF